MRTDLNTYIVISIILLIAISVIFSGQIGLGDHLSASVMDLVYDRHCAETAYQTFVEKWDQECAKEGLGKRCNLDREIARELEREYKTACYR